MLLGAAIFGFFALLEDDPGADERQIVIPEAEIDGLWGAMSMLYGRAPTEEEIEQLVEPRIREEVLYREALALELDRDDSQVRQRLVEKMTFLSEDLIPAEPPSDEDVAAFFEANRETFVEPVLVDFEQLYFSPSAHGDGIVAAAEDALAALADGADPDTLGDSSTVPRVREGASAEALSADLGEEYAPGTGRSAHSSACTSYASRRVPRPARRRSSKFVSEWFRRSTPSAAAMRTSGPIKSCADATTSV